jgi:3-deoxy-D-manno-octulosonic-acid transferase
MLLLYKILYNILLWLVLVVIAPLKFLSPKRRSTFLPRLGLSQGSFRGQKSTSGIVRKSIWIHAVSVGEIMAITPLIKELKQHITRHDIVLSTSARTGFALAHTLLDEYVGFIFYFPFDLPFCVKPAIAEIQPELVIIVEHDIWPNFLFELQKQHIPAILVNAKLSEKTFAGRRRLSFFMKAVFSTFSSVGAISKLDAERFKTLGVPKERIAITGSLKFDQPHELMPEKARRQLKESLHIAPAQVVLIAGSTHEGEEEILTDVLRKLKQDFPTLACIVAPRNPKRAESVRQIFISAGFTVSLMKDLEGVENESISDIIVIDKIGVLKRLYVIANITFIGGSLVNRGGHNPLEAAAYKKPIIFGPYMGNFTYIVELLEQAKGAIRIKDTEHFYEVALMLLKNPVKAQTFGKNAFKVLQANKGAVQKTMNIIKRYLTPA